MRNDKQELQPEVPVSLRLRVRLCCFCRILNKIGRHGSILVKLSSVKFYENSFKILEFRPGRPKHIDLNIE